jgi:hypothetical protein
MILKNVKYYKLVSRKKMLNISDALKGLFDQNNGCLYVKPSGYFYYRRLSGILSSPVSNNSVMQVSNQHISSIYETVKNIPEFKKHDLFRLFDLNQFHSPTVVDKNKTVELMDIDKEVYEAIKGTYFKDSSTPEFKKSKLWMSIYRPKVFTEHTIVESDSNIEKVSNIFDTEYVVLYFNHQKIVKLLHNFRPVESEHTIEEIEVNIPGFDYKKDFADLSIHYYRYHPDILIPVLYLGETPKVILAGHEFVIDGFINRWIPDSILPTQLDGLKSNQTSMIKASDNIKDTLRKLKILTINPNQQSTGVINGATIEVQHKLKIITKGIGAISNKIKLDNDKYSEIWKGKDDGYKISLKKVGAKYVAELPVSITNNSTVKFNMSIDVDENSDLFSAIEEHLINPSIGGIALTRFDEIDIPELNSFLLLYYMSLITGDAPVNNDLILNKYRSFCKIRKHVLYYIYVCKLFLSVLGNKFDLGFIIENETKKSQILNDPLFRKFLESTCLQINNNNNNNNFQKDSLIIRQDYIDGSYQFEYDVLEFLLFNSLDLEDKYSLPVRGTNKQYKWIFDAWSFRGNRTYTITYNDLNTVEKISQKFYPVILNYGYAYQDSLDGIQTYNHAGSLTLEQNLAHEVGHLLAKLHDHNLSDYKYTIDGLSSNHPDKFKVTTNNVINIINDEDNQNESFE